ncbi:MAG: type II toxin-antitoxin system ParD family antitoxin [Gammaproteobacteria bacterium]|nr:type II toxin-antitoxin system ParD family antitoxin [Gammaproteobacteria bacterium]MCY4313408.1 type II toxin-antitoxin system ParD family antitoxin [Gammaproteobacteria bacterium]
MTMVKKSISVTDQQDIWIKAQVDTGRYGNESEVLRALIRERQMLEQDTPEGIRAVRAALIEAEESVRQKGYSKRSVHEIWEEAKTRHRARHG